MNTGGNVFITTNLPVPFIGVSWSKNSGYIGLNRGSLEGLGLDTVDALYMREGSVDLVVIM